MRAARFVLIVVILDTALIALYLALVFTVFSEPAYVPFASGQITTLVPDGPSSSGKDGPWERHYFTGKGRMSISIRDIKQLDLSEIVRKARDEAAKRETAVAESPDLGELVRRARGDEMQQETAAESLDLGELVRKAREEAGERETTPDSLELRELVRRTRGDETEPMAADREAAHRRAPELPSADRDYLQLLASNTPNLKYTQEIPAFDEVLFCVGSAGRGKRWYRYLVRAGDSLIDLSMHSPHSSHLVYKTALDKALINLRVEGEDFNELLEQAVADLSDHISPRWAQGNTFWLIFFLALPTGIMLIMLPVFWYGLRRRESAPEHPFRAT